MSADPASTQRVVWTIGHSNHPLETFLASITAHRIALVVDVRSQPYSRYAPHFNRERIEPALRERSLEYLYLGDVLGGMPEDEQYYDKEGHVRYDRLAQSPGFQQGIHRLLEVLGSRRAAILCSEEDPMVCHRRVLIGRVLLQQGVALVHIRGDGRAQGEEDIAAEQRDRETGRQPRLFDTEDVEPWRSARPLWRQRPEPPAPGAAGDPWDD